MSLAHVKRQNPWPRERKLEAHCDTRCIPNSCIAMSSTFSGALTRSRSLRKPSSKPEKEMMGGNNGGQQDSRTCSPSRLPVKGTIGGIERSASTRAAPAASATGAPATRSSRPISGVFGRLATASSTTSTTSTRRAAAATESERPSPPPQSDTISRPPRTTRSTSVTARPTSSSGVPASSNSSRPRVGSSAHARTKSSVTTLTGATILRPPSQTSASSSDAAPAVAAPAVADRARPPHASSTARPGHRRALSNSSSSTYSAPPPPVSHHQKPDTTTTTTTNTTSSRHHPPISSLHRPAFTTLQKHYSPAKSLAPKALTSTFLAPPSPSKLPANVAISTETSRLQTELLQLHLLHRDAAHTRAQWDASAQAKLGQRFHAVSRKEEDVARLLKCEEERRNAVALAAWDLSSSSSGKELEVKIQALDSMVSGLWGLGEPGGRYARVVRRFERWADRVEEIMAAQRDSEIQLDELALVAEPDDDARGWKDECAGLVRRLEEWRRRLRELDPPPPPLLLQQHQAEGEQEQEEAAARPSSSSSSSSLEKILAACRCLVHDMLAELNTMEQIEREVVADENAWVRKMNRLGEEKENDDSFWGGGGENGAGAIWRGL
ncbi:hypothetical protein B0H63DRAFT_482622 [Podospora didyma]|uniref:Aga1 a-agglutinin anchor subunit n=1 Tax=Podospora didyma TaxID=330526 RepID=A0AAE0KF26_9PEZI|nr:hypothetical protein B0H63DRAFT_482622 [Podospora didyma]